MILLRFDGLTREILIIGELGKNSDGRFMPFVLNWDPVGAWLFLGLLLLD